MIEVTVSEPETSVIQRAELEIAKLLPTAADMIATMMDEPVPTWDTYAGLLEAAEADRGMMLIAVLRMACGLAAVCEISPDDVRGLVSATAGGDMPDQG